MHLAFLLLSLVYLVNGDPVGEEETGFQQTEHNSPIRHVCPPNQSWFQCGPSCGDRRCPSRFDTSFSRCNSRHCGNPGCYCDHGFVRDEHGNCVLEEDCAPQCHDNEQLDRCGKECERQCPSSLQEAGRQSGCHRQTCGQPACVCQPGFYRSPRGVCVKLEDCPNVCGPNEFFNPCGNTCEDTCRSFNSGQPNVCPAICGPHGACQCKTGFYRNSQGRCVPPSMCLQCKGRNEVPDKCAPPLQCQARCGRDNRQFDDRCFRDRDRNCRPGCVCQHGYVRNDQNSCIPRERCSNFSRRP